MRTLSNCVELIFHKAYAELRAEATRAYLGFMWWFAEPILYMAVFYMIFESGLKRGGPGFVTFLLCGLVTWKWFASTVTAGSGVLGVNAAVMQQVYLPKVIFPLVLVVVNTFKFGVSLSLLLLFLILNPHSTVTACWLVLPALIVMQLLLIVSLTLLVAAVVPFLPDLKLLLDNLLMLMFFLSGILFKIKEMSPEMQHLLRFNPMLLLIEAYRAVLLDNRLPEWNPLLVVTAISILCLCGGVMLFRKYDRVYPKIVIR
jgi:lipopolysaccharide transport system permease protein